MSRGDIDLSGVAGKDGKKDEKSEDEDKVSDDLAPLVAMLKLALDNQVKDVRESKRLTDSACCLVVDEGDMNMRLQKMLKASGQLGMEGERILEINAKHPLIASLASKAKGDGAGKAVEDMAHLLLDQAMILEGELPKDPAAFAKRMSDAMSRSVA